MGLSRRVKLLRRSESRTFLLDLWEVFHKLRRPPARHTQEQHRIGAGRGLKADGASDGAGAGAGDGDGQGAPATGDGGGDGDGDGSGSGPGLDDGQQAQMSGFVAGQEQQQRAPAPPSRLSALRTDLPVWRANSLAWITLRATVVSIFSAAALLGLAGWVALTSTCSPADWPFMLWCVAATVSVTLIAWLTAVLLLDGVIERACVDVFRGLRYAAEAVWSFGAGEDAKWRAAPSGHKAQALV